MKRWKPRQQKPKVEVAGAPWAMSNIVATDITSLTIDDEHDLVVTIMVPVPADDGGIDSFAELVETVRLDDDAPPPLMAAARALADATVAALRGRQHRPPQSPCSTCIGNCCGISDQSSIIHVVQEDLDRLREQLGDGHGIDVYATPRWDGSVGELRKADVEIGGQTYLACVHLRPDGCSVYEARPRICREYSAWACDIHEPDPDKLSDKIHLRVV